MILVSDVFIFWFAALLVRTFMFLGFQVLPPEHEMVPANIESNLYMIYSIE